MKNFNGFMRWMRKIIVTGIFLVIPIITGCAVRSCTVTLVNWQKQKEAKADLTHAVSKYLREMNSPLSADTLVNVCITRGMDISFVLAQGQLESGLGTKGASRRTKSVWGVGAWDGDTVYHTSYPSADASVRPYVDLLSRRYICNGKTHADMMKSYVDVSGRKYASDPKYEIKLRSVYRYINTNTNISTLQNIYNIYSTQR